MTGSVQKRACVRVCESAREQERERSSNLIIIVRFDGKRKVQSIKTHSFIQVKGAPLKLITLHDGEAF